MRVRAADDLRPPRTYRRRWGTRTLLLVLAVTCIVAACSSHPGGPAPSLTTEGAATVAASAVVHPATRYGTRILDLRTADGPRTARIHHPVDAGPGAPLVVVLHPATVSALDMEASYGWDTVADRFGLVVAYPDGLLDRFQDTWNGGRCCPPASQLGTDDVGFLDQLVTSMRELDLVGADVYAVGFSNGAIMAYAWACAEPGELAGIGVVAGAVMIDCPAPAAISVVAVHGTADSSIPVGGGPAPDGATFPTLAESLAPFRRAARCTGRPGVAKVGSATITTWACDRGRHAVLDLVEGLGHSWPGAGPNAGGSDGPLDATGFIWAHLSAH